MRARPALLAGALVTTSCGSFLAASENIDGRVDEDAGTVGDGGVGDEAINEPTFIGQSATLAAGTNSLTPAFPDGMLAGDLLLAFFESHQEPVDIANPNGGVWTLVPGAPQGSGSVGANSSSRLTVYFSVYDGKQAPPTTTPDTSGSAISGFIAVFRGIDPNTPIVVTSGASGDAVETGRMITIPGATTTVPRSLVVIAATSEDDEDTFDDWVSPDLVGLSERVEHAHAEGDQGHIGMATGVKIGAGPYGSSTTTVGGAGEKQNWGGMTIALRPR